MQSSFVKDYEAGKQDHKAGYYDKWYRWNRKDDGEAYDLGFSSVKSDNDIKIIECMHSLNKIHNSMDYMI